MKDYIGPANEGLISEYVSSPSHGLIIVAPSGFGKSVVLRSIASKLLGTENFANNPFYKVIDTEASSISIDDIREIQKYLKLRNGSSSGGARVIAIIDSHKMTVEAQNAFLKVLEEPPENTYLLLSADSTTKLLPTILSRARLMALKPYSKSEICDYFVSQGQDKESVERYYIMTGGLVGSMHNLFENPEKQEAFNQAKKVLSGSLYERLIMVDSLSKDKAAASGLLYALRRTLLATLHSGKLSDEQAKKVNKSLSAVSSSEELLSKGNPNLKLLLSNMVLSM